jgi:hypothetical protein
MTGKRVVNGALNGADPPDFLRGAELLVSRGLSGSVVVLDILPNRFLQFKRLDSASGNFAGRFSRLLGSDPISRQAAAVRSRLPLLDPDIVMNCLVRKQWYGVDRWRDRVWFRDGDLAQTRFDVFGRQVRFAPLRSANWIDELRSMLVGSGNQLVLFFGPVNTDLILAYAAPAEAARYVKLLTEARSQVIAYARRQGIVYIDGAGRFDSESFVDMVHVNARGNRRMAELISDCLGSRECAAPPRVVALRGTGAAGVR